jgi:peptidyl-prolyl cis-trans isomerase D
VAAPLTDSDAAELGDQGYSWVRVLAVTPERQKALDEVKSEVAALWTEQERRRLVSELAQKLAERASTGVAFDGLAKEAGGKVETIKDMKRAGGQPLLSDGAIAQAFATPKGRAVTADSKDGLSRTVIRVEDINRPAAPDKAESERLAQEIERQMQNDVLAAYVAALQDKFGVSINQAGLRQATGGAAAE